MIEVEMPDGTIEEFPEGMSNAQIEAIINRQSSRQQPSIVGKNPVTGEQITDFTQAFNQPNQLQTAGDLSSAFMAGANQMVPALAGLPVDTATNLANLAIAGYGFGKSLLPRQRNPAGVADAPNLPELLGPQFLGSQSIRKMMTEGLGGDPFTPPDPQSIGQQRASMLGGFATAGLMAPSKTPEQLLSNIMKTLPSAVGAQTGKELFPDQPLAPIAGAILTPAAISALPSRAQTTSFVQKANQMGYKLLPKHIKGTKTQDIIQGAAGTVPTKQLASIHNQTVTNSMIKRELGIADDIELSPESLKSVRDIAGQAYTRAAQVGTINADKKFIANMNRLQRPSAIEKSFPGASKKDVAAEVGIYNVRQMNSDGLIEASKQLRRDSNIGFMSADPKVKNMARVQRQIADELDDLLLRTTQKTAPDLYPELKAARQTIAKTYTAEKVLKDNGNIDAVALSRELRKGKPLSGAFKDVAEFGKRFPEVAQWKPPQTTNVRGMDIAVGVLGGTVDPKLISLVMGRPVLRKIILSDWYQNLNAQIPNKAIKDILMLPKESQAGALTYLLEQAKNRENETQSSLQ